MAFTPREEPRTADEPVVITDARLSTSEDVRRREGRYLLTMLFRTVCFIGLFFLPLGWWQLGLLAGAAFLPPLAVVLANAADNRSMPMATPYEEYHPQVALPPGNVIPGEVEQDG